MSPYGTYDQSGNVWEWNEALIGSNRGLRGGSWTNVASKMSVSFRYSYNPTHETDTFGFRVASSLGGTVPEPMSIGLMLSGLIGLAVRRSRKS